MDIDMEVDGRPVDSRADHTFRNAFTNWLYCACVYVPRRVPALAIAPGTWRAPPPKPSHSMPVDGADRIGLPTMASLPPNEMEYERCVSKGDSLVRRSTDPPLKSPGWSGVNVFAVTTIWRRFDGKRSKGTTLRSGSGLGRRAPLSDAVVYRGSSPRTLRYFPSWTVMPLTRCSACAASLSGLLPICSAPRALTMAVELRC